MTILRADRLARKAAGRTATLSPVPCTNVFPAIHEATTAIWQERWDARDATSKMSEVTRTVSHPWDYSNIREHRLSSSAHWSHSPNPQSSDVR